LFFTDRTFFPPFTLPKLKIFNKKSFKLIFIESHKFHGDSVKNERARTKRTTGGGPNAPPACLGLNKIRDQQSWSNFQFYQKLCLNPLTTDHFKVFNVLKIVETCLKKVL